MKLQNIFINPNLANPEAPAVTSPIATHNPQMLKESKKEAKKPNPIAKSLSNPKFKPQTIKDKKKEDKKGYKKHKGKIEEAGYEGQVEADAIFKNTMPSKVTGYYEITDFWKEQTQMWGKDPEEVKYEIADWMVDELKPNNTPEREELTKRAWSIVDDALKNNKDEMTFDDMINQLKGKTYKEAGYEGQTEPTSHLFKNVNLASIKKLIADRSLKADAEEVEGGIRVHTYDADRKSVAKALGINEELYINGMSDVEDVINMIKDTIDDGNNDGAKDYLEQFKEYLHSKGITDSVDPLRTDRGAAEELAQEIYNNSEYYQQEYEDWEAFMNSDDFEEENQRLMSKFGAYESRIKPYVSMYKDDKDGKLIYDVLDGDGKSAFQSKDKEEAFAYFKDNFDNLKEEAGSRRGGDRKRLARAMDHIENILNSIDDTAFENPDEEQEFTDFRDDVLRLNHKLKSRQATNEDQTTDEVKAILDKHGIKSTYDIEYGSDAFSDLFDYFSTDPDEMPYGVQKARTGMPDEWIADRLIDLGLLKEDEGTDRAQRSIWRKHNPIGNNFMNPDDYDSDKPGTHIIMNNPTELHFYKVPAENYDKAFDKWLDDPATRPEDNQYYDSTKDYASDHQYWGRINTDAEGNTIDDEDNDPDFESVKGESMKSSIGKAINEAVGGTWDTKNYNPTYGDQDGKLKQFVKNVNPFKSDDYKKLQMAKQAERDNPNWRGEPGDQAGQTLPNGRRAYYRNVNGQKQRVDIYKDIYPDNPQESMVGPDGEAQFGDESRDIAGDLWADMSKEEKEEWGGDNEEAFERFYKSDDFEAHMDHLRSKFEDNKDTKKQYTDKEIKMAFGVLNDPRYKDGNYSGAYNVINKIAPGLADHPSVANALRKANEAPEMQPTQDTQDTTPQKGPDDTKLQTQLGPEQLIGTVFPNVRDKMTLKQALIRLKAGQKITMQHAYSLADAFKQLIMKTPEETQRAMIQLKKIKAKESKEDDAPGYPHQNKYMNQGKTPDEALKDERVENKNELARIQMLAGLFHSDKD
jgi:hypothetical protein